MARRKKQLAAEIDEPGLDISSLIDVCFLLLIYFLVTSQIVQKEVEISSSLPSTQTEGDPPELAPMLILLESSGNVSLQDETGNVELINSDPDARDLPNLKSRLQIHKANAVIQGQKAVVQIRVDPLTVQQRVIDVMNALAFAKIKEITFTDFGDGS